jgi:prevent-host-death family protein
MGTRHHPPLLVATMKTTVDIPLTQARARLGALLCKVEGGEVVIITRRGRPVAKLSPVTSPRKAVKPMAAFRARMPRLRRPSTELLRESRDERL